ncbi:hypothetical protein D9611_003450 [Ephemerocybe angulata]|uniref:Uncharacterized protein n=1 Tax=Ephemerocybe angulata TaxID=980116 RepID=A0A8H5C8U6_9AGAR|nr:hypothetical protein D9611_003450 [Tulosesus angulatus]
MLAKICTPGRCSVLAFFCILSRTLPAVLAATEKQEAKLLQQSYYFSWPSQDWASKTFPAPVTEQCETIKITWSRGAATGPNPVPPYYLQVYTSLFLVPMIIPAGGNLNYDWAVPFPPGTIYQICMFDSNGNTGGCQDTYTIIPSSSSTPVNCANATIPNQLDVEGIVQDGPISRYGWIPQCTDIQLTPKNGTPPYTFTVAPALHPPYNMTGPGPFNWTVALSWSTPFFISVADSAGNMWANGLLHSGGPSDSACLSNTTTSKDGVPVGAVAGGTVGGLILGAFIGLAGMFLFTRKKIQRLERENLLDLSGGGDYGSGRHSVFGTSTQYHPVPSHSLGLLDSMGSGSNSSRTPNSTNVQYQVEPFRMPPPSEDGYLHPASPPPSNIRTNSSDPNRTENKVYVVHHDGNAAPVTIYHEDGTEIVELPPRYPEGNASPPPGAGHSRSPIDARSDITGTTRTSDSQEPPAFLQQRRRPGDRPGKAPRPLPRPDQS